MRQQRVHGGTNGAAREEDVIHKDNAQIFYREIQIGLGGLERLVLTSEVIAEKRDVQVSAARWVPTKNGLNAIPQLRRDLDAPGLNPYQSTVLELSVLLDQLMGETIQGQLELERADEEVLGTHGRIQK